MEYMTKLNNILAEYQNRVNEVQEAFRFICDCFEIDMLLEGSPCWAVVGGAVRDLLLSDNILLDIDSLQKTWVDLDICIPVDASNVFRLFNSKSENSYSCEKNTFGGLKIHDDDIGNIDIWTWEGPGSTHCSQSDWIERLKLVDFGINEIAFAHPQLEIITSGAQKRDLSLRRIEKCSLKLPKPHIQPVRALYLKLKLSQICQDDFYLGELILDDLKWLLNDSSEAIMEEVLMYLDYKVGSNRWPKEVLKEFYSFSLRYGGKNTTNSQIEALQQKYEC